MKEYRRIEIGQQFETKEHQRVHFRQLEREVNIKDSEGYDSG